MSLLPVSAIVPTIGRAERLRRTLTSLLAQEVVPAEVIIVDASVPPLTAESLAPLFAARHPAPRLIVAPARERGAAAQRNQGQAAATQPYVLFLDNDVDLEPDCLRTLWSALQADATVGGCGAVITNQHYAAPGATIRRFYALLGAPATGTLAGACCGPALNFLPAPDGRNATGDDRVEWLNLCCTLFRREALPVPALLPHFHGYSLMEDAALALEVARRWRLTCPPGARLFHDSRPAGYKDRPFAREKMETINRWFVMRCVLGRDSLLWDARQLVYQLAMLLLQLRRPSAWPRFPAALAGKIAGLLTVGLQGPRWRGYRSLP